MRAAWFRELKRYTALEIAAALQTEEARLAPALRRLKACGILKAVKKTSKQRLMTELTADDLQVGESDPAGQLYVFDYVGIVSADNYLFKCYPKYLAGDSAPLAQFKQVLRVLRKYNNLRQQSVEMASGVQEALPYNPLGVLLFLLNDYSEYGAYTNQREIVERDGEGEIDWDKTINETSAILSGGRPYYLNLYTRASVDDDSDYFRLLHQCVVTECSDQLLDAGLAELFSFDAVRPYDGSIETFGSDSYILCRIEKELNVQFVTRKQMLLKTLHAYISRRQTSREGFGLSLYGTNSFNLVWEAVCAEVFGSLLRTKLARFPFPLSARFLARRDRTLIELIAKPVWKAYTAAGPREHFARDTLTPDLVSVYPKAGGLCFGIFDAKYYTIRLDEYGVEAQPGIADITKQFLYQMAFGEFIGEHPFLSVQNAFLFPGESDDVRLLGEVELPLLQCGLGAPLQAVLAAKLPARRLFQAYLDGAKIDIERECCL